MEHRMRLADEYFDLMKKGKKKIEVKLNDEKRQLINIGDIIYFEKVGNPNKKIKVRVLDLNRFKSFEELMNNYDITDYAKEDDTKEKLIEILNGFYSNEEQEKYGVLAIRVEVLEKSCGLAVFKDDKVLLVHHNVGHWGLPKGHVEDNETEEETAIRETKEETNVDAKIFGDFRTVITYSPKENVMKDVVFFVGVPLSDDLHVQESETQEVKYVSIDEALELINNNEASEVVRKAYDYYINNK